MQSDQSPLQSVVRRIWSYSDVNLCPISNKLLLLLLFLLLISCWCGAIKGQSQVLHIWILVFSNFFELTNLLNKLFLYFFSSYNL